jgi:hypothetical protein
VSDSAFTIAAAVNNDDVLRQNLMLSPEMADGARHQLLLLRGFDSASIAYNDALQRAIHDIVVFVHQDMYLPAAWFSELARSLHHLDRIGANWGVLGCYGVRKGTAEGIGRIYTRGLGRHGRRIAHPEEVDTLDEIALVLRRSSGLRFDPALPHFHLYGPDICLTARAKGLVNYAFQGYCVHNTNQLLMLPQEYYACYRYMRRKWAHDLPIYTSCMKISFFNEQVYHRRFYETRLRLTGAASRAAKRVDDPRVFGNECDEGA